MEFIRERSRSACIAFLGAEVFNALVNAHVSLDQIIKMAACKAFQYNQCECIAANDLREALIQLERTGQLE